MRLATKADLGANPGNVQLRLDEAANWAALAERIEAVGEKSSPVNAQRAGWLVGQGTPRVAQEANPGRWVANWPKLRLNPRQRQAVTQALASEALFLWGPPGTGKTDVVAHIVEGSYRQGLNVLFLAPTKVAVDQALERICDLLAREERFGEGLVQRAGEIELPSLRSRYGEQLDPSRIAARLMHDIDAALSTATARVKEARGAVALHDTVTDLEAAISDATTAHANAVTAETNANGAILKAEAKAAPLRLKISKVGQPTGIFADRKAAKLRELQAALGEETGKLSAAKQALGSAQRTKREAVGTLTSSRAALPAAHAAAAGVPPRVNLVLTITACQQEIDTLSERRRRIQDDIRSQCRVLGATVAKAVQSRKLLDRIDVVVIDEAGMVNLPSAWFAAGLAGKRLVVAGDFRQLPAVIKGEGDRKASTAERSHSREWAARDAFHAAGLVGPSGAVRQDPRLVALDTQYRMRKAICAVVNDVAYPDSPLKTGRDDNSRLPFAPLIDAPVILVDTSGKCIRSTTRDAHKSNVVHEAVIHELTRGLQYEKVLPGRKWQDVPEGERATDRLGVIAPYRNQVKALKGSLAYRFGEDYEGLVDTVHRFQGSQRPVMVVDTVAGAGRDPGFFYSGLGLSSSTCRLLNVALSRAQDHLVVVADVAFLRRHLPPGSEALAMLDHLQAHAQTISADQLIPVRGAEELAELSDEELSRPAFFDQSEVPRAVTWDIERAVRGIELYSAFIDQGPVTRWASLLGARAAQGVNVTVFTRPPEEQKEAAAEARHKLRVDQLRAAGCRVEFRDRMHEKVLILDDAVLWHGSKNLLANAGPTDIMMRITDPDSCTRVRRLMDSSRLEKPAWNPRRTEAAKAVPAQPKPGERPAPGVVLNGRLYLNVPFHEKDEAKQQLKAKWDGKLWHVDAATVTREQAARWLPQG
ncbi:AAA family ATPase [Streptomyces sp. ISL-99]|uniref:AAA domain-containing protein n=1 Tax=Streptomyces sp. ISL-99 TaxID=2819193 RepID=UPI001BE6A728|nr:AAA domain-containing protein [Streptomyces sp. ISL-99]MBT2528854.1 AAA family ATPase [Streptomyces sp. ISL-99]